MHKYVLYLLQTEWPGVSRGRAILSASTAKSLQPIATWQLEALEVLEALDDLDVLDVLEGILLYCSNTVNYVVFSEPPSKVMC